MPPGCAYTFYFFWRDFFTLGVTLVFICVSGATFLLAGATFFIWRDFFYLARLFLIWRDLFYLARLFLFGATFLSGVSFMPAPGYGPYVSLIIV